jgi:hypothetical protein
MDEVRCVMKRAILKLFTAVINKIKSRKSLCTGQAEVAG